MNDNAKKATANALSSVLANTYTLYLKTHNFHWNVTGPQFSALHAMFETQYTDMAVAVDELAERIRALGERAPGSYQAYAALSRIADANGEEAATTMVNTLADDNDTLAQVMAEAIDTAEQAGDHVSADMLIARTQVHQKNAWMLRASL